MNSKVCIMEGSHFFSHGKCELRRQVLDECFGKESKGTLSKCYFF